MIIAITGKVGSGKTTVAQRLEQSEWITYDCDVLAKVLLADPKIKRAHRFAIWNMCIFNKTFEEFLSYSDERFAKLLFSNKLARIVSDDFMRPRVSKVLKGYIAKQKKTSDIAILIHDVTLLHNMKLNAVVKVTAPMLQTLLRIWKRNHSFNMIKRWFIQKDYKGICIHIHNNSDSAALKFKVLMCENILEVLRASPHAQMEYYFKALK